jgi:cytochrome P450
LDEADFRTFNFAVLWAANGNSVPTAFWVLYHLLADAELCERVRHEIALAFAAAHKRGASLSVLLSVAADDRRAGSAQVDGAELRNMPILDAVMTEALRLYASMLMVREVQAAAVPPQRRC